jgi:predicted dehydrogenase
MKIAILGIDDRVLQLCREAEHSDKYVVSCGCADPELRGQLGELANRIQWLEHWEDLLHNPQCELVVFASEFTELRYEQLRRFVQEEVPIVLSHPSCPSLIGFELDMIRQDSRSIIRPYGIATHPVIDELRRIIADGDIGELQQIVLERSQQLTEKPAVSQAFMKDVEWIRVLLGDIKKVSGMGPQHDQPQWANLSVQMETVSEIVARWSLTPINEQAGLRLQLLGSKGTATLEIPDANDWTLECSAADKEIEQKSYTAGDGAARALAAFESVLDRPDNSGQWVAACRDAECGEAISHSLRRARTIELYQEDHTEDGAFKGVMAMGGCGLILFGLFVLGIAVLVESFQLPLRENIVWRQWPKLLFGILLVFVFMQVLHVIVPEANSTEDSDAPQRDEKVTG